MARTILIVDDNEINRRLLARCLRDEYEILEAGNGIEALDIIRRQYKDVSAVLLDIQMPVMDGFEVLREMRLDPLLAFLPVIVVTISDDEETRIRALELGANDFIQKPYNNEIIKHCLKNNISLRETSSIINTLQRDMLTGLYNREYFFFIAGEMIQAGEPGSYIMTSFDIDNFKLVNDQLGAAEGNRILKHIGAEMKRTFNEVNGICGRITGDNFAALFPNRQDVIDIVSKKRETDFMPADMVSSLHFSVGRYIITDPTLPVSALYDRAYIAKQSSKGRYDKHVALFDNSMLDALVREQEIVGEMYKALDEREFEAWFQPQYNHATGALIGAEALVRWRNPERGLIPPAGFIPIFEKNGFVYELDKYVWEEACRYLSKWIREGRNPLPISVNVSRSDVFRDDICDVLVGLLKKYDLPTELLRIEITESAFSESSEQIVAAVNHFIALGFTVEIDDFGSGYSSLNTLKDVPAQIIKLDMRFLEGNDSTQRGGYILESIVRMARWLGTAVIAEGVETIEQANFLKSIGCYYVQGYLYAKPMPADAYEELCKNADREERLISLETVVNLDSETFWNPGSMDTLVFNSFVGGAGVFEYSHGNVELLRVNDNYVHELGIRSELRESLSVLDPYKYMDETGRAAIHSVAEAAIATEQEQSGEFTLSSDNGLFPCTQHVRFTLRMIAKAGDRYLFYSIIANITAQRQAEQKEREAELKSRAAAEQLQAIVGNIDGGVTAAVDRDGTIEYLFANDRFFEMLGCTRGEFDLSDGGELPFLHPDDRERVMTRAREAGRERLSYSVDYRIIRHNGEVRWLRRNVNIMNLPDVDSPVHLSVIMDITEQTEANEQLRFLNDMARKLLAQPDADKGLSVTLRRLREYFNGDRAYIFEFDFAKGIAKNTYESCAEGVAKEKGNRQSVPLGMLSFCFEEFNEKGFYAVDNVDAIDDSREGKRVLLAGKGIRSLFCVPLYRDHKLIGLLGIDDPSLRYEQMSRIGAIGDYIAVMITRRDLSAQIIREDNELLNHLRSVKPGLGEREEQDADARRRSFSSKTLLFAAFAFCIALALLVALPSAGRRGSTVNSFSEPTITLSDGWLLTDGAGESRGIKLPETIDFGRDGEYTLTRALPGAEGLILSPALCFYSNYVDVRVEMDGELLYSYPAEGAAYTGATGNTYHFIRLPISYAGRTISISLRCQLGDDITYLIKAPVIGSKATMLFKSVMESLPSILLAGGMLILSIIVALLYLFCRRRLELSNATAFTALFAILFAVYVLSETSYAQMLIPDGYSLFCLTLMLLALVPIPMIGLLAEDLSEKFKKVPTLLVSICSLNLLTQIVLNYTGTISFRVMITATHAVIILSITAMLACLMLSDKAEKPGSRRKLISAAPMLVGGVTDIILIAIDRPSFNNSLWFTLGVTVFVVIQFCGFVRGFFVMYRISLEAKVLRDMAYRDTLTNVGNRNAYERRLKELSEGELNESLCCIMLDINDLKQINDRHGHSMGDAAIVETSRLLDDLAPDCASCFRTGGDEFIVLLEGYDIERTQALANKLKCEAERRGRLQSIPLNLAIGFGVYEKSDGNILDFIRRVDTLMYSRKRAFKESPENPFKRC